jgi:hypothetical protein
MEVKLTMVTKRKLKIEIDYSPVYELVISLFIYMSKKDKKNFDIGKDWYKHVDSQLTPPFKQKLDEDRIFKELRMDLFYVYCSPNKQSIPEFFQWMKSLNEEEIRHLYLSALHKNDEESVKKYKKSYAHRWIKKQGYIELRDYLLDLWQQWEKEYFRGIHEQIPEALKTDALEKKLLAASMEPFNQQMELFLKFNKLLRILAPQYHSNPFNIHQDFSDVQMFFYPVDLAEETSDHPSKNLLRITKCLADETRLKIFEFCS